MSIWKAKIHDALAKAKYLLKQEVEMPMTTAQLAKSSLADNIGIIYAQLGGKGHWQQIELPTIDIWAGDYFLMIDDHLHFNRYRGITLRAPQYQKTSILHLDSYQRYCRQYEAECKKAGLAKNLWTTTKAEQHFGEAAEVGEFEGNGSPAWKLRAFEALLIDSAAVVSQVKLLRLPIYANLMVGGQLMRLDKLLMVANEQYAKAVLQWIARSIGSADTKEL